MDIFALIVFASLALAMVFIFGVGFASRNKPIADVVDKKANERWASQAMIEAGEVPQMVDSANEYRRKKGLPELSQADFHAQAAEEQQIAIKQARKHRRSRRRLR